MNQNLIQPIYEVLEMFFPASFFTNPFFSFIIDIVYLCFGISLLYMIFILPIKYIIRAFRGTYV